MGDNKISEAAVEAARDAYHEADVEPMRAAIEAALNHLQDEAVPVACVPDDAAVDELRRFANSNIGSAHGITRKQAREVLVKFANFYLHPQPAELSEVSGGSGELVSDIYKVASTPGMTPIDLADWIRDVLMRNIYALAATGKQQVGEVQGSREQFEAWAQSNNYSSLKWPDGAYAEEAMQLAWKAWLHLASRQPVGAQGIDLGPDTFFVQDCPGYPAGHEVHPSTLEYALKFISEHGNERTKLSTYRRQHNRVDYTPEQTRVLIEQRDAGTGVE